MTTTQKPARVLPGTEVAVFAAAVRSALSDLPPDELDELTDGLEADLAERAAETPDAVDGLGDPAAYAEELRSAAGYPPRSARSHLGDALPDLRSLPGELRRRWDALLTARPLIASVVTFLVTLRPAWWVLRGVAAYALLAGILGVNGVTWWPVGVAAVVLSVHIGRGRMRGRAWVRWAVRAVSAVVIIALPFMAGWALSIWNQGLYPYYEQTYYPQGLSSDGVQIDNIFAYDAEGNPIDRVQLFDQNGDPLNTVRGDSLSSDYLDASDGSMLVPSGDVPGRAGWNVYPLAHVDDWSDYADDNALDDSEISPTEFPLASVKPLAGAGPVLPMGDGTVAAPVPTPTASPAP